MGAPLPYYSSRWLPSLNSKYPPAPRKCSPGTHVWVSPKPRTHIECEPRFSLPPRTSYTTGCQSALVGRDISSLDWILLKVINFALVPRLRPEINSRACFWVSPRPRHWAPCWLASQRPSLFCKSRLDTPTAGSGPRNSNMQSITVLTNKCNLLQSSKYFIVYFTQHMHFSIITPHL